MLVAVVPLLVDELAPPEVVVVLLTRVVALPPVPGAEAPMELEPDVWFEAPPLVSVDWVDSPPQLVIAKTATPLTAHAFARIFIEFQPKEKGRADRARTSS